MTQPAPAPGTEYTPEAIARALAQQDITVPRLLVHSLMSWAMAGPTNDASVKARDYLLEQARTLLNAPGAAQPQREGLRDRLLDSPDLPPLPWSSAADRQPWPNDASDHRRIVDANGKPLFSRNWKESCAAIEYLVRAANRAALAIAQPTESCSGCHGRRWTEDENWQPDDPVTWHGERTHRNGLIPCGFCNHGGWTTPDYEPAAAQPAEDEL